MPVDLCGNVNQAVESLERYAVLPPPKVRNILLICPNSPGNCQQPEDCGDHSRDRRSSVHGSRDHRCRDPLPSHVSYQHAEPVRIDGDEIVRFSVSEQGDCWIIFEHRLVTCPLRSLLAFIWH